MEQQNFLQRPGGLGPMPALKPLGMPMANPSAYMNDEISISSRRQAYIDDVNRVFCSVQHRSVGSMPVLQFLQLPTARGTLLLQLRLLVLLAINIAVCRLPERAVDMPEAQYLSQETNKFDPSMSFKCSSSYLITWTKFL